MQTILGFLLVVVAGCAAQVDDLAPEELWPEDVGAQRNALAVPWADMPCFDQGGVGGRAGVGSCVYGCPAEGFFGACRLGL